MKLGDLVGATWSHHMGCGKSTDIPRLALLWHWVNRDAIRTGDVL
jgi:hypothetical protein